MHTCAGFSEEERLKLQSVDVEVAVCGCVARHGCRIVAEDIPHTPDPRTELIKSFGLQAYACHPLLDHQVERRAPSPSAPANGPASPMMICR